MPRCARRSAHIRVFCFDEDRLREITCDSACDPVFIAQREIGCRQVEAWKYEMSNYAGTTMLALVICQKNAARRNEANGTLTRALRTVVYGPAVIALVEEGIDKAEGDFDDEFSVLVSLEAFMQELGARCGRTDADSNGIYDLLEEMRTRAPVWVLL
jgi:hypothetical protein